MPQDDIEQIKGSNTTKYTAVTREQAFQQVLKTHFSKGHAMVLTPKNFSLGCIVPVAEPLLRIYLTRYSWLFFYSVTWQARERRGDSPCHEF